MERRGVTKIEGPRVPMDEYRAEVVECVRDHSNAVIIGETGSGKTTRIPDFLLDEFPEEKIAITQPRRVAARSVSRYVAGRRGIGIGEEVGYQVRFEDETTEGTRCNFMTDGILLRKLQYDKLLEEYDIVMVDEAHERNLNIDFVLGLLKGVQAERRKRGMKELKVIATSATIEKEKFANYFDGSPVVEVPGRMFPVDVRYEKEPVYDPMKTAAQRVKEIVSSQEEGDVLIFMPGESEIKQTISEIEGLRLQGIEILPLFGSMAPEDQDKIFEKNSKRKVIVSTNIAETSVTIDGVRFVIDSGLIKQKQFNPSTGIEALVTRKHAKSGCEQRKGRAGRTASGTCYRLYTEKEYQDRDAFQTPEIARSNLDHVILAMKKIGIEDVRNFDFIDRPKDEAINHAIETLKMLGALDEQEHLTEIGKVMSELPLRPELARMVIEAEKYGCVGSVCTVAAMFGEKSVFVRPKEKEREADAAHAQFKKGGSDFLTLLEVWKQWAAAGFNDKWARDRFLNVKQLFEVREIRSQLMRELKRQEIVVDDKRGTDDEAVQKSITAGLIQHLVAASGRFGYERVVKLNGDTSYSEIFIHPSSAAFTAKPKLMLGAEVVTTSKTFARKCQPVKPEWLPEIAPQLLQEGSKVVNYDPESDTVRERVGYSLKGRYGTIVERDRDVTDEAVIQEQFARALAEGKVNLSCIAHNNDVVKGLQSLRTRSGGLVSIPDLPTWYKEQAGGAKSRREASYIDDRLKLQTEQFCSPEMKAEIDRLYPEQITVNGHNLKVEYEHRAANLQAYYESERKEKFKATVHVPREILFELSADDFPPIGSDGQPEVVYRSGDNWSGVTDADLEKVKETVDKKRIEEAWYQFKKPEAQEVMPIVLQPLPTMQELGIAPIAYTKDFRGNDVFAYPAYRVNEQYDYDKREYVKRFQIEYFRTEDEANQANTRALENKKEQDAKEQRKVDRETLLVPAQQKYEALRPLMDKIYDERALYGLSTDDYYRISDQWKEAGRAITSSDSDPRRALEIMTEIENKLSGGKAERERRAALIPEVQAVVDRLTDKVGKITYSTYSGFGLSYDQYNDISDKWRRATELLRTADRYGSQITPDPEAARTLLAELEAVLPSEEELTPEQEALRNIFASRDSGYAQILRVSGGRVIEYAPLTSPESSTSAPTNIPIGGSGRSLRVRGSRVTFILGSGNPSGSWDLSDGSYVFSRDANTVLRVTEQQGGKMRATEFVNPNAFDEPEERYVQPAPVVASSSSSEERLGTGVFASLLSKFGKQEEKLAPPEPEKKTVVRQEAPKLVEKEKMTEELRSTFLTELAHARIFLDTVRAVPEPKAGGSNADKISKARQKAADAKRDLGAVEQELATTDDAARARGKVSEITRRAEKLAEEVARLRGEREDWAGRYKTFTGRLFEVAKAQDVELDEATLGKIRPKLVSLSQRKGEIADVDGELETIIIESI